jgi:hypothetical protein
MKADVPGTDSSSLSGSFSQLLNAVFTDELKESISIFDRISPDGLVVGFHDPVEIVPQASIAEYVSEGASFPVLQVSLNSDYVTPKKHGALTVCSRESLNRPNGMEPVRRTLLTGLRRGIDSGFLADIKTLCAPTVEASANKLSDVKYGLDYINQSGAGRIYAIGPSTLANELCTEVGTGGSLTHPDTAPVGESVFLGMPFLPCDVLTDDFYLVDATSLVIAATLAKVKLSENASVEMSDAPDMDITPSASSGKVISSFQLDLIAFLATRSYGVRLSRARGACVINGIATAWTLGSEFES